MRESESPPGDRDARIDEELLPLVRLLERSEGFALAFLQCNVPVERQRMVGQVVEELARRGKIGRILRLDAAIVDLEAEVFTLETPLGSQDVLFVLGFEHSIPSDSSPHALHRLNLAREKFRDLPCPLVLVLPEYALTLLAREAPDFWAWRSGVFEVRVAARLLEPIRLEVVDSSSSSRNLSAAQREQRLRVLTELLDEYSASPGEFLEQRAQIVGEIAALWESRANWSEAAAWWRKALEIYERIAQPEGIAWSTLHLGQATRREGRAEEALAWLQKGIDAAARSGQDANTGHLHFELAQTYRDLGRNTEALSLYGQAQAIYERTGGLSGSLNVQLALARMAQNRGDLEAAENHYAEALEISERIGDLNHRAVAAFGLGQVGEERGDLEVARAWYQVMLEASRQSGNREAEAMALTAASGVARSQGDLDRAETLTRLAWANFTEMGDRSKAALCTVILGQIARDRGDLEEALAGIGEAVAIFEELDDRRLAEAARAVRDRIRDEAGLKSA